MGSKISRRTTIKDVARACNVAPSTVSNAFSDKRYVNSETRKRILKTADELGYQASTVARSLRLQRSWTIGFMLADIANPFYPEVIRGVEDVLVTEGWNLFLCNTNFKEEKQARYIDLLAKRQVDGIILASHPNEQNVISLRQSSVPCVLLNKGHGRIDMDYVGIDHKFGISLAFDHLMSLGHRRIAFIQGHAGSDGANQRFIGYLDCLKRNHLVFAEGLYAKGEYDFASGKIAAYQFLSQEERPTAIIAANDTMALGAISVILEAGLNVPEDMSVVGFDDIPVASMARIELTTVRVPKQEMGRSAAQILLARIKKEKEGSPDQVIFPVELIERGTTGPYCS